jgi:hypothetical protein
MDRLFTGMLNQNSEKWDSAFATSIRNQLFGNEDGSGGLDLIAFNIQRGRDHGIAGD